MNTEYERKKPDNLHHKMNQACIHLTSEVIDNDSINRRTSNYHKITVTTILLAFCFESVLQI
jgi:hypothetical protein